MDDRRDWKNAAALAAAAFAARIAWAVVVYRSNSGGIFQPDSLTYWRVAENIVHYGRFSASPSPPLEPLHLVTPLYPLFIAAFLQIGLGAFSVIIAQAVLSAASCVLAMKLCEKLGAERRAALFAGILLTLDLPSIVLSSAVLTETLFTFLFLAAAYCVFTQRLPAGGFLAGLAALCRPVGVFFPFLLAAVLGTRHPKPEKSRLGIYLAVYLLAISPWVLRNTLVFHEAFMSSSGAQTLLYAHGAGIQAELDGIPLEEAQARLREKAAQGIQEAPARGPLDLARREKRLAVDIIREHPLLFTKNLLRSQLYLALKPVRSDIDVQLGYSKTGNTLQEFKPAETTPLWRRFRQRTSPAAAFLVFFQVPQLAVLWFFAILGFKELWKRDRRAACLLGLHIAYFFCLSPGLKAYARLRVPVAPFLAVAAGLGLAFSKRSPSTKVQGSG